MTEVLASSAVAESVNSPGWFLVHTIGIGMGILGLVFFFWVLQLGWFAFLTFIRGCMRQEG